MSSDNLHLPPEAAETVSGEDPPIEAEPVSEDTKEAMEAEDVIASPKKKRKREKRPPDPTDPAVIAAKAAVHTAKLEAEAAALAAAEEQAIPTPAENAKYYTSLVLGTLCIVSAFAFLFLVPFVLDPAISTLMHDFVEVPVTCKVSQVNVKHGKSKCLWSSCREGCTVDMFTCYQVRVIYAPEKPYNKNKTATVQDLDESEWIDLTRMDVLENKTMIDTPLLVNIKGCGYPPDVACARFASDYETLLNQSQTFPCYFSRVNPWIVIERYEHDSLFSSILMSIIIPNVIFVISLGVLLYWWCPYCQAKCHSYDEQIDQEEEMEPELEVDAMTYG